MYTFKKKMLCSYIYILYTYYIHCIHAVINIYSMYCQFYIVLHLFISYTHIDKSLGSVRFLKHFWKYFMLTKAALIWSTIQ